MKQRSRWWYWYLITIRAKQVRSCGQKEMHRWQNYVHTIQAEYFAIIKRTGITDWLIDWLICKRQMKMKSKHNILSKLTIIVPWLKSSTKCVVTLSSDELAKDDDFAFFDFLSRLSVIERFYYYYFSLLIFILSFYLFTVLFISCVSEIRFIIIIIIMIELKSIGLFNRHNTENTKCNQIAAQWRFSS